MNRYGIREKPHLPNYNSLTALMPVTLTILMLASLLLVVQTSRVATTGYDITRQEQVRDDWRAKNYQLEAEISYLESLDRIEKEAVARFKMKPATEFTYITVSEPVRSTELSEGQASSAKSKRTEEERRKWWDALLHPLTFLNESHILK